MKITKFIIAVFLSCLFFISCNKHNDQKDIIGKWGLNDVTYMDSMEYLHGEVRPNIN